MAAAVILGCGRFATICGGFPHPRRRSKTFTRHGHEVAAACALAHDPSFYPDEATAGLTSAGAMRPICCAIT
ncbi:MAG: hypothetical protein ACLT98_07490 [Eggerthellaceae bacterium]